jgi:hypothetical protein
MVFSFYLDQMIRPIVVNIKPIWKILPAGPANDHPNIHLSANTTRFMKA